MNRRTRGILTVVLAIALAILFFACTTQSAGRRINDTSLQLPPTA